MSLYKKLFGFGGVSLVGLGLLSSSANFAKACDHTPPTSSNTCYKQVWVTAYESHEVPYTACVTTYDECGRPHHEYKTYYHSVSVPVRKLVSVSYESPANPVNNSKEQNGAGGTSPWEYTSIPSDGGSSSMSDGIAAPAASENASGIDLVLEDVQLADEATSVAGPAYRVRFRNQGTDAAGKFQVGILAGLDGKIGATSPRIIVDVPKLAAGESREMILRLPMAAMKMMRPNDSQPKAFTHLFVSIDLTNAVTETDKTNNSAMVERTVLNPIATN